MGGVPLPNRDETSLNLCLFCMLLLTKEWNGILRESFDIGVFWGDQEKIAVGALFDCVAQKHF